MTYSVIQEKGQVTIPSSIRRKLGLKKGDLIAFLETDKGYVLKRKEIIASETLATIGQILKDKGVNFDELMDSGREIRGQLLKDKYNLQEE